MRAGLLRERITIQRPVESREADGSEAFSWEDAAADVAAQLIVFPGREAPAGPQELARREWVFRIRKRSGLDERMRIVWREQVFLVRSITPGGRRLEWLDLSAESVDLS